MIFDMADRIMDSGAARYLFHDWIYSSISAAQAILSSFFAILSFLEAFSIPRSDVFLLMRFINYDDMIWIEENEILVVKVVGDYGWLAGYVSYLDFRSEGQRVLFFLV